MREGLIRGMEGSKAEAEPEPFRGEAGNREEVVPLVSISVLTNSSLGRSGASSSLSLTILTLSSFEKTQAIMLPRDFIFNLFNLFYFVALFYFTANTNLLWNTLRLCPACVLSVTWACPVISCQGLQLLLQVTNFGSMVLNPSRADKIILRKFPRAGSPVKHLNYYESTYFHISIKDLIFLSKPNYEECRYKVIAKF